MNIKYLVRIPIILSLLVITLIGLYLVNTTSFSQASSKNLQSNDQQSFTEVSTEVNYLRYEDVDALDQAAQLIVIGEPTQDFINREHVITFFESGDIQDFYTLTDLKIEKVIKQPDNFILQSSKTLQIVEPVTLVQQPNGKEKLTMDHYQELKKGSKYIIFLQKNSYGVYGVINMNLGKFNLDSTDHTDLDIEKKDREIKSKLIKDILIKYGVTM